MQFLVVSLAAGDTQSDLFVTTKLFVISDNEQLLFEKFM